MDTQTQTIITRIKAMASPGHTTIFAIDGRCASGKTSYAGELSSLLGCPVIHMDDFFLRVEQRTPERYAEPGGNVDRERFYQEVLCPLKEHRGFSYQRFDCAKMELADFVTVPVSDMVIVEGSYSLHPDLRDAYDLSVFLTVAAEKQLERILKRSNEEKLKMFQKKWIPLEESYFSAFEPEKYADFVRDTTVLF